MKPENVKKLLIFFLKTIGHTKVFYWINNFLRHRNNNIIYMHIREGKKLISDILEIVNMRDMVF